MGYDLVYNNVLGFNAFHHGAAVLEINLWSCPPPPEPPAETDIQRETSRYKQEEAQPLVWLLSSSATESSGRGRHLAAPEGPRSL